MRIILFLCLASFTVFAEDPPAIAALMSKRAAIDIEIAQAKRDWIKSCVDLSPLEVGARPKDPRESDLRAYNNRVMLADQVSQAEGMMSTGVRIESGERFHNGPLPVDRAWENYRVAYDIVLRNYAALAACGRIKTMDVPGNPKPKPKLKAVLSDGTVVEQ